MNLTTPIVREETKLSGTYLYGFHHPADRKKILLVLAEMERIRFHSPPGIGRRIVLHVIIERFSAYGWYSPLDHRLPDTAPYTDVFASCVCWFVVGVEERVRSETDELELDAECECRHSGMYVVGIETVCQGSSRLLLVGQKHFTRKLCWSRTKSRARFMDSKSELTKDKDGQE